MENGFITQTAKDYDIPVEEVKRIREIYPDTFYEELEYYIKTRRKL